ncbi:hypothetical protein C481_11070 [Natrialba asiatica DSM 12278]|uniref:Uncharacterized protein n=1 Tax=Natrialba asiatica (strain ATCC 700177 / DSM 12278 / JCM 9576 / FERM P-10747 / NBRC 102637 / 172P1) TaxID=29540 RepID=M0APW8_NATA1|nr:hypothetical protein C481_11070 [Natrialba asiatica DSM 12278]
MDGVDRHLKSSSSDLHRNLLVVDLRLEDNSDVILVSSVDDFPDDGINVVIHVVLVQWNANERLHGCTELSRRPELGPVLPVSNLSFSNGYPVNDVGRVLFVEF